MTPVNITSPYVTLGCDPEFFFKRDGEVIGSEKVIDIKKGFVIQAKAAYTSNEVKFIVDGVQAELNPQAHACRANLANEISNCFRKLVDKISGDKSLTITFAPCVKVSKEELLSLDEKSQQLGCAPSENTNPKSRGIVRNVDPLVYLKRSAGGHIHIGNIAKGYDLPRIVNVLDVLLANTCVLIDRDEGNKERRKVYGLAGEYRTPKHGLEYRTLSNFWLKAYPLMSFVFSMARFCVGVSTNKPACDRLLEMVNMDKIHKAINTNNYDLARRNFECVKDWFKECVSNAYIGERTPLCNYAMGDFEYFLSRPIEEWFPYDPIKHWTTLPEAHNGGWESFITNVVPQVQIANLAKEQEVVKKARHTKKVAAILEAQAA